ncbi:hypothetical protein HPB47_000555 [Ixodes persulcatus]|uniref:Uncharacterized protein n=1 Tax=Ixodes persulcatus TaxID=34615 RepID=A0AC60PRQ4_IXOPE|nr:hypothetical protein HPB47_000555 [Ixodes persulcatus]
MTVESIEKIQGSLKEETVKIQLPKFDLKTEYGLVPALKKLGVRSIFSDADLSGITGDRGLVVTDVQHKAAIQVNEEGTVAAAATVILFKRSPTLFVVNRPFLFYIREKATGRLLFLGEVHELPAAKPTLAAIPGLHHSMYADDITLWVTKGSDAELEETLELGVHTVCTIAAQAGRASTHHKLFTHRSDVLYVDAAEYGHRPAFAAVATTSTGQVKTCATVFTAFPEQAEEAAIALALTATPCPKVIVSDSKAAILNFAKGYISAPAQTILRAKPPNSFESNVSLIWTPAHAGLCGNELAHSTARGYTVRAGWTQSLDREARSARERLVGFYDITSHYRLSRRLYPPATQALSREESVMWRQLQTHSFPSPLVLSHIYPSLYNPTCIFCSARATLSHILWECPSFHLSPFPSEERWDAALRSSDPTTQLQVVRRAAEVAEAHGLPATRCG